MQSAALRSRTKDWDKVIAIFFSHWFADLEPRFFLEQAGFEVIEEIQGRYSIIVQAKKKETTKEE